MKRKKAFWVGLVLGGAMAASRACIGLQNWQDRERIDFVTNRLGAEQVRLLRSVQRVETTLALGRLGGTVSAEKNTDSDEIHLSGRVQGRAFTKRLADILLDPETYATEGLFGGGNRSIVGTSCRVDLVVRASGRERSRLDISIFPDVQEILITAPYIFHSQFPDAYLVNYAFVAPRMIALLKSAFPTASRIRSLKPLPPPAEEEKRERILPSDKRLPLEAQQQLANLRIGMTRADLLRIFETEGGISTRFQNHYNLRGVQIGSQCVKINVRFAPKGTPVLIMHGFGLIIDPKLPYLDRSKPFPFEGAPDDVIVGLSTPHLGYKIFD